MVRHTNNGTFLFYYAWVKNKVHQHKEHILTVVWSSTRSAGITRETDDNNFLTTKQGGCEQHDPILQPPPNIYGDGYERERHPRVRLCDKCALLIDYSAMYLLISSIGGLQRSWNVMECYTQHEVNINADGPLLATTFPSDLCEWGVKHCSA